MQNNTKFLNTESRLVELVEDRRQGLFSNHLSKSYNCMISSHRIQSSTMNEEAHLDLVGASVSNDLPAAEINWELDRRERNRDS